MENKWVNKIKEYRIDTQAFKKFKKDIYQYNLSAIIYFSLIGMIGGGLLFIASLPPFKVFNLIEAYGALAAFFAIFFIMGKTILTKYNRAILPVYYLMIVLLLSIGIVMGTFMGKTTNATTFLMMILVVRFFIVDKPWRLNIVIGIMCIIFCLSVTHVGKVGELAQLDIWNCIVFYLFGVLVSHQTIRYKIVDITVKRQLKKQADTDSLTQLNNRGVFERLVNRYVTENERDAIMIIMDIDNFKSVNDTMGHAYGDMVLQLVGEYIKESFRSSDIVSRLGGDEFVAFLPFAEDVKVIENKVQELIDRISAIKIESDDPVEISASIGIALYPKHGKEFQDLYKMADKALYYAKEHGKGQYAMYDPDVIEN